MAKKSKTLRIVFPVEYNREPITITVKPKMRMRDVVGDGPTRSIGEKILSFGLAYFNWLKQGSPSRTPEQIEQIYDTLCKPCEFFKDDTCTICGCAIKKVGLVNKIKMVTEHCPLSPPKW